MHVLRIASSAPDVFRPALNVVPRAEMPALASVIARTA